MVFCLDCRDFWVGLDRRDITAVKNSLSWLLGSSQVTRRGEGHPIKPSQREWFSTRFGHGPKL